MADVHKKSENPKLSKKEIIKTLTEEAPMYTKNKFIVSCESDDCGNHVVLRVERNTDGTSGLHKHPDIKHMGWRVISISVPEGYLNVFYNADGSKQQTKDADDLWFENEGR